MLMMLPFEAPTIFEGIHKSYFRMPRVVKDQRSRFENDDLFRQLSHESAVKYTGFKDRPLSERQNQFITDCYLGHTEVSVVQSGNQFTLMFTPTANPAYDHEGCFIDKEQGKAHIKAGFILNGVCVLWRGWIDLQRLEGFGCLEFDEYRAYLEDAMAKQQADGAGPKQPMCNSSALGVQQQTAVAPPPSLGRLNHHLGGAGVAPGAPAPPHPPSQPATTAAINQAAAAAAAVAAAAVTTNSMLPLPPAPPVGLNSNCLSAAAAAAAAAGLPGAGHPQASGVAAAGAAPPPVSLAESAAAHYGNAALAAAAAAAFHQALSVGPGGVPQSLNGLHGLGMGPQGPPTHPLVPQHLAAYTQPHAQQAASNTSPPHHHASPTHPFLSNNNNNNNNNGPPPPPAPTSQASNNGLSQAAAIRNKSSPERENLHYSNQQQNSAQQRQQQQLGTKRTPSAGSGGGGKRPQQQELEPGQTDEVDVVSDMSELDFPPRRLFKGSDSPMAGHPQPHHHHSHHKISRRAA